MMKNNIAPRQHITIYTSLPLLLSSNEHQINLICLKNYASHAMNAAAQNGHVFVNLNVEPVIGASH